jgi:hypothetical protein
MARRGFGTSTATVTISRQARRLVLPVVCSLIAALLLAMPGVAFADPTIPRGATTSPPRQAVGSAAGRSHEVTTSQTRARTAGTPARTKPPKVRGAVGHEVRHADPLLPPANRVRQQLTDRDVAPTSRGPAPGVSTEDPFARTPYSTTFNNPDGTTTLRLYEGVSFVPDPATGSLRRLEPTLVRRANGRWEPAAAADVSIAGLATDAAIATLRLGGGAEVGFGLDAASGVPVKADGSVARFAGVARDSDIELSATATGIKEDIVLHSASAPTSWLFPLRTKGVTPAWDAASGSVRFVDVRTGQVRATIPPGFMVDSNIHPVGVAGNARTTSGTPWCNRETNGHCGSTSTRRGSPTRRGSTRSGSTRRTTPEATTRTSPAVTIPTTTPPRTT